jgi:hypothetical protein
MCPSSGRASTPSSIQGSEGSSPPLPTASVILLRGPYPGAGRCSLEQVRWGSCRRKNRTHRFAYRYVCDSLLCQESRAVSSKTCFTWSGGAACNTRRMRLLVGRTSRAGTGRIRQWQRLAHARAPQAARHASAPAPLAQQHYPARTACPALAF